VEAPTYAPEQSQDDGTELDKAFGGMSMA